MRRVVVESPFAGDLERNAAYLDACLADCVRRDESPYASHGLLTRPGVLDDADPEQRAAGIAAGLAWHAVADAVVVYTDLGVSRGMQQAVDNALNLRIPLEVRSLGAEWPGWRRRNASEVS